MTERLCARRNPAMLVLVALAVTLAAPSAGSGGDTIGLVEAYYRDLMDLTAQVEQKNYLKTVDKTQAFKGTLKVKRPGKLRLEYTNGQVIVIDGTEAWFYSKKNEQAIRRTFQDFEQANIPVAFLLGAAHIRDDFDVVEQPEKNVQRVLELTPKRATAAMTRLILVCDDAGRITTLVVHDRTGNTSTISFAGVRENTGLNDSLFRFKAPKGTEIIEQ